MYGDRQTFGLPGDICKKLLISDRMNLSEELSKSLNIGEDEAITSLEEIAVAMAFFCGELDSVSIPGFGTFQPIKNDERIVEKDGKQILVPPSIKVEFKPSVVLRKSITK